MHWKEEYLHFIWKYQLFEKKQLISTRGEAIIVHKTGLLNTGQGPDFLHASVQIGAEILHGHIEIHIDNKDWYNHAHQNDPNYQNIILHVVLHNTQEAYTLSAENRPIPILCLENYIAPTTLTHLQDLMTSKKQPACQNIFKLPSSIQIAQFKSRLIVERILRKSNFIQAIIQKNLYHYENAFYQSMLCGFGLTENSECFLALAQSIPQTLLAKYSDQPLKLEAVFFGQSKLIEVVDAYSSTLKLEYDYLCKLHQLEPININVKKGGMLPASFPTIRLAQFVGFIQNQSGLYNKLTQFEDIREIYSYFQTQTSDYWKEHYDFGKKEIKIQQRKISKAFVEKLIINFILPFRFLKEINEDSSTEKTLALYHQLQAENNAKTRTMQEYFGIENKTAYDSQALIEWYSNYCEKKKCLDCPIGFETLR